MLVFLVLLAAAAYFDYRAQTIPDLVIALLWGWLLLHPGGYFFGIAGFACAYLLIAALYLVKKLKLWGWGDVLIAGPFFAFVGLFAQGDFWGWYLAFLGIGLPLVIGAWKKKPQPLIPWLLVVSVLIGLFF